MAFVVSLIGLAAACSSFDEGGGSSGDVAAGPDGSMDASQDASAGPDAVVAPVEPLLVVKTGATLKGLCASNRGVAWTTSFAPHGFIDGVAHSTPDETAVQGPCLLTDSTIRFTDSTSIRIRDLGADAAASGAIAYGLDSPGPLATDGTKTFTAEMVGSRSIVEVLLSNETSKELAVGANGGGASAIVANSTFVVVGTENGEIDLVQRGTFGATLVRNVPNVTGLALTGNTLYVSSAASPGTIQACTLPACSDIAPIATGRLGPSDVTVVGDDLYWLDRDDGQVVTCKRASCMPRTMATVANAVHLAVGDRIYIADSSGVIYSVLL
jgi:hypothetical protein